MKFDEAGTYKIEYTATDSCGNSTTEDRLVEVMPPPRTVWASSNPRDKTYAHIDGGTSNPGYFTAKA